MSNTLNPKTLWQQCLQTLKLQMSSPAFVTWFTNTSIVEIDFIPQAYRIKVGCPSYFVKNTLEKRYHRLIVRQLQLLLGGKAEVVYQIVQPEHHSTPNVPSPLFARLENQQAQNDSAAKRANLRPHYTFANFAVSSSNQMAYAAAEAVAEKPAAAYNPLFVWGGVGVGKTHLMSAVGHALLEHQSENKMLLCTGEEFTNDIVDGIRNKTTRVFREKYRRLNLLMIDDIQFIAGKDAVQEEFFHTFNAIVASGGQVIMTSDKPPEHISKLEERLRSRFEAGLIVDIAPPDFELRCAIVGIKATENEMELPSDIVSFIAGNVDSARKIQGVLIKIKSETLFKKQPLSQDLVRNLLAKDGNADEANSRPKVTPQDTFNLVCKYYNLHKRDLVGQFRAQKYTLPRQILMYLLRIELNENLANIGALLGNRDHTTVMHAVEKLARIIPENVHIRQDIENLKKQM